MSRAKVCQAILVLLFCATFCSEAFPQFGGSGTQPDSKLGSRPPRRPAAMTRGGTESPAPTPEGAGALPPSLAIEIPDEPRTIDPVTLLPPELTRKSTVAFEKTPFKEVVKWLRDEAKLNVVVDPSATAANHLLSTEPVTDALRDEPIYFLLDRLETLELGWHIEEGVLFLESFDQALDHRVTISYNLGALFDAGFRSQPILDSLQQEVAGPWDADEPGTGTLILLGDVRFVRQHRRAQFEVAALLAALEKHGRRTVLVDPPQHVALSETLRHRVTVRFQNLSIREGIQQLAALAQTEIRFDSALKDAGVNVDEDLISLSVSEQPLQTVLSNLQTGTKLAPEIRAGALWLTTADALNEHRLTAVFDVRDLCRSHDEAGALGDAIQTQTAGPWDADQPGTGTISFVKPGVLVVRQTRPQLDAVLDLLESYRMALKASKPRPKDDSEDKQETLYYRVPTAVADDLLTLIPRLVAPESWQGADTGQGTILKSTSFPETAPVAAVTTADAGGKSGPPAPAAVVVTPYSVLIIRQSRKNHRVIDETIHKIRFGDTLIDGYPIQGGGGAMGGGMGGFGGGQGHGGQQGGGFGGGFFRIPADDGRTSQEPTAGSIAPTEATPGTTEGRTPPTRPAQ